MIGKWIQKIKKNKRRIGVGALALFLAGVMGVNLLQNSTGTVYAAESQTVVDPDTTNEWTDYIAPGGTVSTQNVGRIWTDKSVTNQNYTFTGSDNLPSINKGDSDFIVALSALSSTSNLKTMVTTNTPLDIVLVLDRSSSMNDDMTSSWNSDTRLEVLKEAVNNFVDATATANGQISETENRHNISVITFSDDANTVFDLTTVTTSNSRDLKQQVNRIRASGNTYPDVGFSQAESQFNSHGREGAKKVVIFFTDGVPAGDGISDFEGGIAADAVDKAYDLKQNGTTIYSIGVFQGANPNDTTSDFNAYMNAVSSKYPNATAEGENGYMQGGWWGSQYVGGSFEVTWNGSAQGDYYKVANDADELNNIFQEISDEIQKEDPSGSPIEETTSQGNTEPGSLTFTDTLGAYMHVTGIGDGEDKMQIAYADKVFTSSSKTTSGNIDTYHFEGEVAGNTVYGAANLSDLTVTVERSDDLVTGDIVTVTIPASLIPMRHYDVDTNNPSMTVTSAYPVRLFYGVSVKEEAKKAMNDSSSDVYNEIAKTNLSDDKKTIDFYSNLYTTGNGNTTADFTPNIGNKFYYYTDDTELYVDENCATRATTWNIARYDTLYYSDPYWTQGNGTVTESNKGNSISRNGLDWSAITYDQNGNAYIPGHTQRKDRPNTLNSNKSENKTGTAITVLSPEWTGDNSVTQHLGNNGKISYPAAGQLEIKKGVDWGNASDETKQNQNNFTFTVELTDENDEELIGEFPYDIYDENSDQPVEVDPQTMIQSRETITLKAGQRAVISNLPSGAKYKVTEEEANENGFTTTDTSSEETNDPNDGMVIGAIVAGSQQSVSFQNDYSADKPVLLSTEGTIQVKKVLDGREWRDDDEFTFSIRASNEDAAPLPQENTVTITKDDEKNDFTKAFGDIEFKKSGEYRYSISEINEIQEDIVGIDYSAALYRVIVNVVDGGNGQLKIDSIKLDRMAKDDGTDLSNSPETINPVDKTYTATYTNKYIMDGAGTANIAGTKTYYDHSGLNPIDGSKFLFKLNALGGYKTADGMPGDTYPIEAENVPMPRDEEGNIVAEAGNVVNDFTFRTINFDGNDVGNTYVYEVTEIPRSEANMNYDQTVYTVTIKVTEDTSADPEHTGHAHINTSVSYKKTLNRVTEDTNSISFVNNYDPTEVTLGQDGAASIIGTKTLTGRNMTDQDVFNFKLTPYGNVTNTAINNEIITGIDSNGLTATVTGPVDKGVAKEFSFENITFKKPGTYRFLMDETDSGISNGITYDESTCVVTVTIGLDKDFGKLIVENIAYANNDNNFVNSYNATLNYGEKGGINVTKQMLGRPMKANEFAFSITGTDSINVTADEATNKLDESDKNFANIAAARDTTITMSKLQNLTFDQNDAGKTFSYIVDELEPGKDPAPGVTYDQSQYQIDIEVIDNGDGTMHAVTTVTKNKDSDAEEVIVDHVNSSVEGYVAPTFGFVNDYNPTPAIVGKDADYQLTVNKTVTGAPNTDDFTFRATFNEEASTGSISDIEGLTDGSTTATITEDFNVGDSKLVDFGTLTFKAPGEYVFTVQEETTTDKSGWTYDNNPQNITIVVTDLNKDYQYDGNLYIKSVTNNGLVEITNSYSPDEIIIGGDGANQQIMVQKSVTGSNTESDFTFQLEPIIEEEDKDKWNSVEPVDPNFDRTATINDGVTTDAPKTVSFGGIKFSEEGTFEFKVSEVGASDFNQGTDRKGWTYDEHTSKVTINITDSNFDGYLEASIVYDNSDATTSADKDLTNAAAFTNKYSTTPVKLEKDTDSGIGVQKQVTGAPNTDDFAFSATFNEEASTGSIDDIEGLTNGSTTATITEDFNDGDSKSVDFDTLTFKAPGEYVFTVKEDTTTDDAGWTYDSLTKQIKITVVDNGDGTLVASVDGNDPLFVNKYEPNSVTLEGEDTLKVTKKVIGAPATEEFQFTLALTEGDASSVTGLDENNQITLSTDEMTGENAKTTDTVDFGQLTFSKVGNYVFTVTEDTTTDNAGWTYDNDPKTITVEVTDEGFDGQLDATVDGNNPTVTNKYEAADFTGIPTDFTLTKVFEGKTWATEDVFEFTLTAGENTAGIETPMPTKSTVQVNAPTEKDGKTAKFDFGSISYDTVGEYHYTVSETEGTNAGIKYSKNVAEITVTVTDNKQGGLVASANVVKGTFTNIYSSELDYVGKGGIELVKNLTGYDLTKDNQFTFTLNAADEASKVKAGMENMSQDVFNTEDTMDANGLSTSTIQLLPNMDKFTQDDVGKVYKYTISETSEQKPGYTNDTTEYTIEISTVDDGKGTLTVSTHITGTNGTDITYEYTQSKQKAETGVAQVVFNNTYTSSTNTEGYDASVNLTGTKTLTNRPMVANEFNFQVIDNKGNEISTGTNTADGTVAFTPINYTNTQLIQDHANGIASKDGNTYTYVYDVKEVTPQDPGTTIVAGEFSVTVEVTDNGDGKLTTNVIYPETGLAFENAYGQSANAELNIHGTKKLAENGTNHPDITGKFQFTITGSDGAPMPEQTTVTNDASGNINFGKIVYTMQNVFGDDGQQTILEEEPVVDQEMPIAEEQTTEDGTVSEDVVGLTEQVETYSEKREKTFTYTITESGSLPGVTNDSAKVINVKVIDNGDGTISVTSDTQGTFTFVNTYVPDPTDETSPTDSAVTIKKVLDGRTLKADEFSFTMMDENGNGVQATNAEDGSVVFPKLTFDKEGIYTYTISEVDDSKGGVAYDTTTYKAIATVTDDTSGKLKVEWKVTDAQGKEINEITFNNKYTVQPTSLTLGATKVLEGRELADKEFLFVLSDEEGNVVEEAYNDKTGKVTFSDLTFDKAGTYNYTVTEKNTNAKGITYDESVYNIQVEVVDNEGGTLNMTTTTTKDGEVSSIVFKNKAEKDSVPEQPEKGDTSNTSTRTFAGLFTSLAVDAAALAGVATLLKKRNAKK